MVLLNSIHREGRLEAYGCRFKIPRFPQRVVEHPDSDNPVRTLALFLRQLTHIVRGIADHRYRCSVLQPEGG